MVTQTGGKRIFPPKSLLVYISAEIFYYEKGGHNILSLSLVKLFFSGSITGHILYVHQCVGTHMDMLI